MQALTISRLAREAGANVERKLAAVRDRPADSQRIASARAQRVQGRSPLIAALQPPAAS